MKPALLILPAACWIFIFLGFRRTGSGKREAFLGASVVWGLLLAASSEVLSLFRAFDYFWIAASWAAFAAVSLVPAFFGPRVTNERRPGKDGPLGKAGTFAIICAFLIAAITLVIALASPPNNWDSMTYHMSRVAHWLQNQSIHHYPTNVLRQIHLSPGAELVIAHLMALGDNDNLANLVQWGAMSGSLVGVSLIAKMLGLGARGQAFSALAAATLPMGILQSTSTQNDYVLSLWLVSFIYWGALFAKEKEGGIWKAFLAGAALGLAVLTKGTAYIYAFPFVVWFALEGASRQRKSVIAPAALIAALVLLINAGHYARNQAVFGSPLGPGAESESQEFTYTNSRISAGTLASNLLRNAAIHMGLPFQGANRAIEGAVVSAHRILGLDPQDKATTWGGTAFRIGTELHEDLDGNPAHILLIIAALAALPFIGKRAMDRKKTLFLSLCIVSGFLLFSLLLRWQPWHSRLHLPLFVAASPLIGMLFSFTKKEGVPFLAAALLFIATLPWLLFNYQRPLLPYNGFSVLTAERVDIYFRARPELKWNYVEAAGIILRQDCTDLGLMPGAGDMWEYPIWPLLGDKKFRLEHVDVKNESAGLGDPDWRPCLHLRL
ncbi:MAG: glycosyltransferase family 39 protein [Thermodesulfobacteriota bacterium]|nr:MAG: glycosyltransferase family 39 protein [Thermodesulfobacteriota bacterium]